MTDTFNRAQNVLDGDSAQVFIVLLTISHAALAEDIRVSSDPTQALPSNEDNRGTISNDLEYVYIPFTFIFPNQEADSPPRCKIKVSNISREIGTAIRSINSAPTVNVKVVLSGDPDVVEIELPDFKLLSVIGTVLEVEGELTVEHFEEEPYPAGRFNPSGFPGLFSN